MIEELDLFSFSVPRFKIDKPIRLIELFAGIGSQAKALKNLGVQFEHWKIVEWDRFAVASYNAIHCTDFTTKDISQTHAEDLEIKDRERYTYIMTYSFPCQDISGAGHGKGLDKGSGTRSGLLWEVERILDECTELPQVLLMENVPLLIGKKHIKNFQLWRRKLETLGYSNYVQLLNAKDYGIPQNRNRCFMVSILGDYYYSFPKKQKLDLKLKDMLEKKVDEKYYLSNETVNFFISNNQVQKEKGNGFRFEPTEGDKIAKAVQTKMDRPETEFITTDGGGLLTTEQENINQTLSSTKTMKQQGASMPTTTSTQSKLSKTIRSGGRGSLDRHEWDIIYEDDNG